MSSGFWILEILEIMEGKDNWSEVHVQRGETDSREEMAKSISNRQREQTHISDREIYSE
jgi:hypothetical protein